MRNLIIAFCLFLVAAAAMASDNARKAEIYVGLAHIEAIRKTLRKSDFGYLYVNHEPVTVNYGQIMDTIYRVERDLYEELAELDGKVQ